LGFVTFTEAKYTVAGAGHGTKLRIVRFHLQWKGFSQPPESGARIEPAVSRATSNNAGRRSVSETKYRETRTTKKVGRYYVPS
jgi:cellulose synthase (UDP-forming)